MKFPADNVIGTRLIGNGKKTYVGLAFSHSGGQVAHVWFTERQACDLADALATYVEPGRDGLGGIADGATGVEMPEGPAHGGSDLTRQKVRVVPHTDGVVLVCPIAQVFLPPLTAGEVLGVLETLLS